MLLLIFSLIAIGIIGMITIFVARRKNQNCSCLGKTCKTDSDCLTPCCDTNSCVNGKCCSNDCSGKNCSQQNTCGQQCSCPAGQVCFQGNCCQPHCQPNTCGDDGCGGSCSCDPGSSCITDSQGVKTCCTPPDCKSGFCGTTACGSCKCRDVYCGGENACCEDGKCSYEDICKKNSDFAKILGNSWAKLCQTCTDPLDHCTLTSPDFYPDSFIPKSGTISCTKCQGENVTDTIQIDGESAYYDYDPVRKKFISYLPSNYCKDSSGKCNGTCVCLTDADCKVYGCSSCEAGFCL